MDKDLLIYIIAYVSVSVLLIQYCINNHVSFIKIMMFLIFVELVVTKVIPFLREL